MTCNVRRWVGGSLVALGILGASAAAGQTAARPDVVDVFVDKGDTFIRAGSAHGVRVGMNLAIVGPAAEGGTERPSLGHASVMQVWEGIARVSLDSTAQASAGARFARLPSKASVNRPPRAPKAPPAVAQPTQPAEPRGPTRAPAGAGSTPAAVLVGEAHIRFPKRVAILNKSDIAWTGCSLTLNDGRQYSGFHVGPWRDDTVRIGAFIPDLDEVPTFVDVRCAQGSARFVITPE